MKSKERFSLVAVVPQIAAEPVHCGGAGPTSFRKIFDRAVSGLEKAT